jgi:hypothetical protein
VDAAGILRDILPTKTKLLETGPILMRELTLGNENSELMKVTIWGDRCKEFDDK